MAASQLSRRERQIMDILYQRGKATAAEVKVAMDDAPSYSAVRAMLRVLEEKGHVRHIEDGRRFVYLPTEPRKAAAGAALRQVIKTFFGGSLDLAVTAFLMDDGTHMSDEELDRLTKAVELARAQETEKE